ncbi:MAG: DUF5011 domain-containing protein [Sphingobacteriaceae bacterium]|nr:DUF5011 domain-containing protein [Sphingobacteriaceae bacterium]MBK7816830.1 DUF5011 domain-containing protein [Sphingobacteriaceae bacterium]
MSILKTHIIPLVLISLMGCDNTESPDVSAYKSYTAIVLEGEKVDTAFMFVSYADRGATVNTYTNGIIDKCSELVIWANVSGSVNTNIPGTYILSYTADDSLGVPLAPASRTVHVVENSSNFLSGVYKVAFTCTAISGSDKPIVTSENYTAVVNPANGKGHFQLLPLNIGPEQVIPQASLNGNTMSVGFFSANYASFESTGTLSPSKNTFTIESWAQRHYPSTNFYCKNVYSKLITIKTEPVVDKK